ncbi:hypothetical protein KQH49_05565 [Mycetohabitans sp. B5]|uniref:Uncharacterized protein n=1 Tax=Mycetohabitans endofungorum TaxID=417203 RepID=A0A2P5KBS5_9BURK|nr:MULTISPECIES: hypothetical protein [Mycetohabitans]MCG1054456.1 hypothetical protein [Mycetohabitans sp. B5]PPB84168.1 hypothetical protein B0O95_104118 [Mycetohabitans endofungorum]
MTKFKALRQPTWHKGNASRASRASTPKTDVTALPPHLLRLPNEIHMIIAKMINEPNWTDSCRSYFNSLQQFSLVIPGLSEWLRPELEGAKLAQQASDLKRLNEPKRVDKFTEIFASAMTLQPRRPSVEAYIIGQMHCLPTYDAYRAAQYVAAGLKQTDLHECQAQYIALFNEIPRVVNAIPSIIDDWRSDGDTRANLHALLLQLIDAAPQLPPHSNSVAERIVKKKATEAMLAAALPKLPAQDLAPRFDALVSTAHAISPKLVETLAPLLSQLPTEERAAKFDGLLSVVQQHGGASAPTLVAHLHLLSNNDRPARWHALLQVATQHRITGVIEPLLNTAVRLPGEHASAACAAVRSLADQSLDPSRDRNANTVLAAVASQLSAVPQAEQQPMYEWLLRKVSEFPTQSQVLSRSQLHSRVELLSCLVAQIHRSPDDQKREVFDMLARMLDCATPHNSRDAQTALEDPFRLRGSSVNFSPSSQPWIDQWRKRCTDPTQSRLARIAFPFA